MVTLKIITTALDALFTLIILWFCKTLSWQKEVERFSIVGFLSMIVVYLLNTMLIWM